MLGELRLDDKTYAEIMREAMTIIPSLTRQWTDFNPQDTGIMLLELCAALTEMQRYYLDQVGERHYKQYIRLLTGSLRDDMAELLAELEARVGWLCRAVTPQDYVDILTRQHRELRLDECHVESNGLRVTVHVYRKGALLSDAEIQRISRLLESYRLLTIQICVRQIPTRSLAAICDITLSPIHKNPERIRAEISGHLKVFVEKKDIADRINLESIRSLLLSIPDVVRINRLEFSELHTGDTACVDETYTYFKLEDISVPLREGGKEGANAARPRPPIF